MQFFELNDKLPKFQHLDVVAMQYNYLFLFHIHSENLKNLITAIYLKWYTHHYTLCPCTEITCEISKIYAIICQLNLLKRKKWHQHWCFYFQLLLFDIWNMFIPKPTAWENMYSQLSISKTFSFNFRYSYTSFELIYDLLCF